MTAFRVDPLRIKHTQLAILSSAAKTKPRKKRKTAESRSVLSGISSSWDGMPSARVCLWLLLFVIAFFVGLRFHLRNMPLERDEGEYAYAGQLILQGIPPYQLAYNMKLPGTYVAYALILALFGQTPAGIHIGLLLVNGVTSLLLYLLAKRLMNPLAGLVAGSTYALLSTSPAVMGFQGHATHFVVMSAVAGVLVLLQAISSGRTWLLLVSGLMLGLAFLMKQPGACFGLFGALYLLWSEWKLPLQYRTLLFRLGGFALGFILPFALTCLVIWRVGAFQKFWFWTFSYAREYGSIRGLSDGMSDLTSQTASLLDHAPLVWAVIAVGLTTFAWDRRSRPYMAFCLGLLVFSLAAVSAGFYYRAHYFILLLPAVALLAGVTVNSLTGVLARRPRGQALAIIPALVFFAAFAQSIFAQSDFLFAADPVAACRSIYSRTDPFPEALTISDYIKQNSPPTARVAVLGSEPEIYFYSSRHSATGYIYTFGLMENQKFAAVMEREMISEIEAARPEFIVLQPATWPLEIGSPRYDWTVRYLGTKYDLVGIMDKPSADKADFVLGQRLQSFRPTFPLLYLFRRKG